MTTVLILGSRGMVGREVFNYFSTKTRIKVWGTTRNNKEVNDALLFFQAESYEKDIEKIYKSIKRIDYIINCIGLLNDTYKLSDIIYVNALFPHLLEKIALKHKTKL